MKKNIKTIISIIFIFNLSSGIFAKDAYMKALEGVSKGHIYSAIETLSELTFDETDNVKLGEIYAILAISYTLQDENADEKCKNLLLIIPEDMQDTIGSGFVKFLSGKIASAKLKELVHYSNKNWQAAAVLARYLIILRDNPDIGSLNSLAGEYKNLCSSMGNNDWGNLWINRIEQWQNWISKKTKNSYGLEKLIRAKKDINKNLRLDIKTITLNQYEDLREKYKKRPKEASLIFDKNKVKKYIETLPDKFQKMEATRFQIVASIKPYIVKVLERSPYPDGVKTRSGKKRGTITMANEEYLVYKKSPRSRKTQRIYWRDLNPEQYSDMMAFYAERRAKISGAGQKSSADMKKDAASDYLGAAILSDWFGNYEDALKYAKKAINFNPPLKDKINELILK